jgi:hypothetical protein
MNWHVPEPLAESYVDGAVQGARAASIEAHLLSCETCRTLVGAQVSHERLNVIWTEVEEEVDAPRPTWIERLLCRCGMSTEDARLLAAAPSLQLSWLASLVAVLAFAVAAAQSSERGAVVFLVLAPLAPVVAVAGAYGRGVDPTYEVTRSTPYPSYRLLILRVTAVVAVALIATSVLALLVTDSWVAVAWLLPCLAMVSLALLLSRWIDLTVAAVGVGSVYIVTVGGAFASDAEVRDLYQPTVQLLAAAVATACTLLIVASPHNRMAFRRIP